MKIRLFDFGIHLSEDLKFSDFNFFGILFFEFDFFTKI